MLNQESIWIKQGKKTNYQTLNQDIGCDVLIVGGGICGLTSAYYLRDQIRNIALIEADTLAYGASGAVPVKSPLSMAVFILSY